jgi:integrase
VVATLRSFTSHAIRQGWIEHDPTQALERRHVVEDHNRAMGREELDRLFTRRNVNLRDRCLWLLLYETAARANEVLSLNVEDVDLRAKRAYTVRKGGDRDVLHFQTRSARLLPKVINGRTSGPLFLAETVPAGSRAPAALDLDPTTGRARLSYRRAAEIFSTAAAGRTLHQLRHSAITHLAEDGTSLPLLMAKSRHVSLATLQRYARPSVDAVARLTAEHDPARRR